MSGQDDGRMTTEGSVSGSGRTVFPVKASSTSNSSILVQHRGMGVRDRGGVVVSVGSLVMVTDMQVCGTVTGITIKLTWVESGGTTLNPVREPVWRTVFTLDDPWDGEHPQYTTELIAHPDRELRPGNVVTPELVVVDMVEPDGDDMFTGMCDRFGSLVTVGATVVIPVGDRSMPFDVEPCVGEVSGMIRDREHNIFVTAHVMDGGRTTDNRGQSLTSVASTGDIMLVTGVHEVEYMEHGELVGTPVQVCDVVVRVAEDSAGGLGLIPGVIRDRTIRTNTRMDSYGTKELWLSLTDIGGTEVHEIFTARDYHLLVVVGIPVATDGTVGAADTLD